MASTAATEGAIIPKRDTRLKTEVSFSYFCI
jgi:hypothetical protein